MSNLTEGEIAIVNGARAALNETLSNANEANQDLQSVMQLDDVDEDHIATKPAARNAVIRLRAALVAAIAVIDGIEFPAG